MKDILRKRSVSCKLIAVILVAIMVTMQLSPISAYADDSAQDQLNNVKAQQEKAEQEKEELVANIEKYNDQIAEIEKNVEVAETEISEKQAEIDDLNLQIEEMQGNISTQKNNLGQRVRTMYKNGSTSFLDIIFNSKDFSELMSNVTLLQRIYKKDQQLLAELEETHKQLETKKEAVAAAQRDIEASKAVLQIEQKSLDEAKAELEVNLAEVKKKAEAFAAEAQALEDEIRAEQERRAAEEAARRAAEAAAGGGSAVEGSVQGSGVLGWPVRGPLTSFFGYRDLSELGYGYFHTGLDIGVSTGTPVCAADGGVVMSLTGWYEQGYGWGVFIDHGNGIVTVYGHNSSLAVSPGQTVAKGQVIAYSGSTGWSTGPHVHFEVRVNGACVDPLPYLQ